MGLSAAAAGMRDAAASCDASQILQLGIHIACHVTKVDC